MLQFSGRIAFGSFTLVDFAVEAFAKAGVCDDEEEQLPRLPAGFSLPERSGDQLADAIDDEVIDAH